MASCLKKIARVVQAMFLIMENQQSNIEAVLVWNDCAPALAQNEWLTPDPPVFSNVPAYRFLTQCKRIGKCLF